MQRTEDKKRAESFKPGQRLPASWVQKVENFISSFKVLSGGQFIWDGRTAALQIWPSSSREKFLWEPGEIDNDSGTIIIGDGILIDTTTAYEVEEAEVTVSAGESVYAYIEMPYNGAPTISTTTLPIIPVSDLSTYRHPLVELSRVDDVITVKRRLCTNVIVISGLLSRL